MKASLTASLVALALIVPAPPLLAHDFSLGGRVGIAFANFGGDIQDLDETDSKAGASLGAAFGLDFGWMFGGGIDLAVGPGALTFDVRYNLGLTDINDLPGWTRRSRTGPCSC